MPTKTVQVYSGGEPKGTITWNGSQFRLTPDTRGMQSILRTPMIFGKKVYHSHQDPDGFLDNLYRYYRSGIGILCDPPSVNGLSTPSPITDVVGNVVSNDEELTGGHWVTTEHGQHIYIKDGEIVAGNPHLLAAIKEQRGRIGIAHEPTTPPPPGKALTPDVEKTGKDGITKAARVGVPAMSVPPPPPIERVPNLTPHERAVESDFKNAYEKAPDRMAANYRKLALAQAATKGEPPTFATDDAKVLSHDWSEKNLTARMINRSTLNVPLHQTANALAKRAFLQHLNTLKEGDHVLVTVGGCGCHVEDTPIMLADGSLKMVQDIEVGDELMGPDSGPRKVLRLIRGRGRLYDVVPKKGKRFRVNEDHVLSVVTNRWPGTGKRQRRVRINLTVRNYNARAKSFQRSCVLHRTGIDLPYVPVALDPYFLGVWLGNGTHSLPQVTTPDTEIADYLKEFSGQYPETELVCREKDSLTERPNKARDYRIALLNKAPGKGEANPVVRLLKAIGVFKNKHIPKDYLHNDRRTRLRLLAGLLDTDGSLDNGSFDFLSKSERLAQDVTWLARSLGFAAYCKPRWMKTDFIEEPRCYWRVSIHGEVSEIPTLVARKQAGSRQINKNALHVGFHVEPAGEGDYYGFTLEGDGLYLLDDFTVTHNSGKGYALKKVPQALELKKASKAVWDSAGDQNATENPWVQREAEKRGLKVDYVYVHADPKFQWADPERGVVKRAADPKDGRMVDAHVFADSYAIGAKNHQKFYQENKDNPNASFIFLVNKAKPEELPGIPKESLALDRHELTKFAREVVLDPARHVPAQIKRGATLGDRLWSASS
jgi:hypothetical protein